MPVVSPSLAALLGIVFKGWPHERQRLRYGALYTCEVCGAGVPYDYSGKGVTRHALWHWRRGEVDVPLVVGRALEDGADANR